jgi:hypothetical protein
VERIEGLHARGHDIGLAALIGTAFASGKALADEHRAWRESLRRAPGEVGLVLTDADRLTIAYIQARWPTPPREVS